MRDVRAARLAIFNGMTEDAGQLVDDALQNLQTVESSAKDLGIKADQPNGGTSTSAINAPQTGISGSGSSNSGTNGTANATALSGKGAGSSTSGSPTAQPNAMTSNGAGSSGGSPGSNDTYVPFEASVARAEGFVPTPQDQKPLGQASAHMAKGEHKQAAEVLRAADIQVMVTAAMLPAGASIGHVQDASKLLGQKEFYEASQALKAVEDSIVVQSFALDQVPTQGSNPAG